MLAACTSSEFVGRFLSSNPNPGDINASVINENSAPDFQLELLANDNHSRGDLITLSQFARRPVVLNFWFPSCPPCRLEMPELEESSNEFAADGVQFIGIQSLGLDSVEDGQDFIDEFGVTFAVGPDLDNRIHIDYKVRGHPTTVFLNKHHQIVRKWEGSLTAEKLDELIQELLQ